MALPLANKVFLITGASKGIGRGIALHVASLGASVVLNYGRDRAAAESVASEIDDPSRVLVVQADGSKIDGIEKLVDATVDKFGRIDVVVPNAGVMDMVPLEKVTEESYDRHFDLNVKGPLFLVQKSIPHMPPGGRIILVSSGVTIWTNIPPAYLLYAATKGAIEQFVRVMSKDLGTKGISVNALAPGPTATELFFTGKSDQMVEGIKGLSPFKDLGKVEDMANLVAFLARDESRWISGQTIRVNGAMQV